MEWKRVFTVWQGYPFAVAAVLASVAVLLPFRSVLASTTLMLLCVPVIVTVGSLSGVRASATAAIVAFLLLDFLFVPPYHRLTVASLPEWLALVVFLIVALVSGQQTARLKEREQAAVRRQAELELLNGLTFRIASEKSARSTGEFIVSQVTGVLGAERAALYVGDGGDPTLLAEAGRPVASSDERSFVDWVMRTNKAVGLVPVGGLSAERPPASVPAGEAVPDLVADGVYVPLQTAESIEGVLYARRLPGPLDRAAHEPDLLVAIANLAAASLSRRRLEEEAAHASALREADRLRSTLVSSVSHDLKTPLAAATARVTGLVDEGAECSAERVRDELVAVADDLERLNVSIGDLLDLSRLESESWRPQFEDHEVSDVLGTVLSRIPASQRSRLRFELPPDLPAIHVDFSQIARTMHNLVENALAYSPATEPVTVGTQAVGDEVRVWVQDAGPGVSDAEKSRVFEKFYRGEAAAAAPAGTGLGLAIAREIVRSHGGRVWVEDVEPTGARFVVSLPFTRPVSSGGP